MIFIDYLFKMVMKLKMKEQNKLYKIKTVDIAISIRSTKPFFRTIAARAKEAMSNSNRTRKDEDRYFRDTIIVTAYARNLGLQ